MTLSQVDTSRMPTPADLEEVEHALRFNDLLNLSLQQDWYIWVSEHAPVALFMRAQMGKDGKEIAKVYGMLLSKSRTHEIYEIPSTEAQNIVEATVSALSNSSRPDLGGTLHDENWVCQIIAEQSEVKAMLAKVDNQRLSGPSREQFGHWANGNTELLAS